MARKRKQTEANITPKAAITESKTAKTPEATETEAVSGLTETEAPEAIAETQAETDENAEVGSGSTETKNEDASAIPQTDSPLIITESRDGNPFGMEVKKDKPSEKQKLTAKQIAKRVLGYIFIDGLSGMALGLFATLIIGTIIGKIGSLIGGTFGGYIVIIGKFAQFMMGAGIALGMGYKLKKAPLVSISAAVVGMLASFAGKIVADNSISVVYTMVGEPLCAFIASFAALEVGSLVSGKTKVDIIVTPLVTVLSGALVALLLGRPIDIVMSVLREAIRYSGQQQPFLMGILVAVLMGVFLTLPISSAAIGLILGLDGIVAGAAVVGCCTHMVGYAVMSFRENKWGGLLAQGVGTSMLQMPNLVRRPILWLPPVIVSAILGPISTCALKITSTPTGSGMGTAGLVGIFETVTSLTEGGMNIVIALLEVIGLDILAPAVLCFAISELMRRFKLIHPGDLKLDL